MKSLPVFSALVVALAAAAVAAPPAAAQEAEAWVLPRGFLEVGAGGRYTHYDRRLGGDALGAEFVPAQQAAVDRVLEIPAGAARIGVAQVLASLPGGGTGDVAETLTTGRATLGMSADVRQIPFALRYGLSDRVTVFASLAMDRRGTDATARYLAGGNLGLNPAPDSNRARLERVNAAFADLGSGLLLPVAGSPAATELQARLQAASPGDTLRLPAFPVGIGDLLSLTALRAELTPEEAAVLGMAGERRGYGIGDLRLGARMLVLRGPAGWPHPEAGARGMRTVLGVHARLPTGRGGVTFPAEIPAGGGHPGFGVELLNDFFPGGRWWVHAGVELEHALPADVVTLAFAPGVPFPADTALRTVRRTPGARLQATLSPRWRLTDDIAIEGLYALVAQAATAYEADGAPFPPPPLAWETGGSAHAVGAGIRFSTLQASGRNPAVWPLEVSLGITSAVVGTGDAPRATTIRFTGRLFADRRRLAAMLPERGAAEPVAPAPAPATEPPGDTPADTFPPADEPPPPR
jgi:hypothetical protein